MDRASDESDATDRATLREDPRRFGEFVARWREALRRMVELRMDPRLKGRLDASDVVQEACAEAIERLPQWIAEPELSLHLWLRFITAQKLLQLHRRHLDTDMRDAAREVPLDHGVADAGTLEVSAVALASAIVESGVLTPAGAAQQSELNVRLHAALTSMKADDREVLVLRHFEQLSNAEVAQLLGLSQPGASLRYLRAAKRLRELLGDFSDVLR
jgi:RNA polymerase sigma-70 factor (ECF subfamily)